MHRLRKAAPIDTDDTIKLNFPKASLTQTEGKISAFSFLGGDFNRLKLGNFVPFSFPVLSRKHGAFCEVTASSFIIVLNNNTTV